MKLSENEYTTNSLIFYLTKKFGKKISGQEFNHSDIAQYCIRGYLPFRYGGEKITIDHSTGIKIITLSPATNKFKSEKIIKKSSKKKRKVA